MNFSDLPNNSWEKVMVHLIEHIGGDGGHLVQWGDKIPDPVETANAILGMVQYLDPYYRDLPEGALAKGFRAFYNLGEYDTTPKMYGGNTPIVPDETIKNEYITKASIDFEKSCVHLTIAPPGSLERIKIDCVLADKEND